MSKKKSSDPLDFVDASEEELRPLTAPSQASVRHTGIEARPDAAGDLPADIELGGSHAASHSASASTSWLPCASGGDSPVPAGAPMQWHFFEQGAGQLEFQGYETWTPMEKSMWKDGTLKCKWGIGQVSIRLPVPDATTWIAIVYGYLPFAIPIWWALWALFTLLKNGHTRFFPCYGLAVAVSFAITNELVTKRICKRLFPSEVTNRPPEAVCKHPGMPSGHVMNAYTLMIWCLLETLYDDIVHLEWLVIILVVMGPVPWARVHNKDHTVGQVVASALAAIAMGGVAYCIRRSCFPQHAPPWDAYSLDSLAVDLG